MNKEKDIDAEVDQRLDTLRDRGYKEGMVQLVRNATHFQIKFLSLESVLAWLDEEISKIRDARTGKGPPDKTI